LPVVLSAVFWTLALAASFTAGGYWWPASGLTVTSYATTTWSGPVLERTRDATVSTDFLDRSPRADLQQYSVEWTGELVVRRAGLYRFWLSSDDGSSLELDGETVVDNGGVHVDRRESGLRDLDAGLHPIRVRYFQAGGQHALSVLWGKADEVLMPLKANELLPESTNLAAYRLRHAPALAAAAATLVAFVMVFTGLRRRMPTTPSRTTLWIEHGLALLADRWWAVAIILAIGGAVRLALLASMPAVLWPDSQVFHVTMRNILHGEWRSHDPYRTLAYPYFLAGVLGGREHPWMGQVVLALQLAMGLVSSVVFYVIGRRAFTPAVALASAVLFAGHALQLYYEVTVLTETLFTLVLAITLWAGIRAIESFTLGRAVTLALLTALLVLVRPVAQWYVFGLLAVGVVATRGQRGRLVPLLVAGLCYTAPIVGWMSVNQHEYGFFGVSLGRGMGLYTRVFDIDGLPPPQNTQFPELRELYIFARSQGWSPNRVRDELNYVRGRSAARADDEMYRFSRETVLQHPLAFASNTVRMWVVQMASPLNGVSACRSGFGKYLCSRRAVDDTLPSFPNRPTEPSALRPGLVRYVTHWPIRMDVVLGLALLGLAVYVISGAANPAGALVVMTIAYMTLVPAVSQHPQDRFRLPIDCLLFMCAAYGIRAVARRWPMARPSSATS
jgi:hypothetical protein